VNPIAEEVTATDLPSVTAAQGQTILVDTRRAVADADIALDPTVGLELEHDSAPGTVVFSAATVSRDSITCSTSRRAIRKRCPAARAGISGVSRAAAIRWYC
jgi:hypothetical protein